MVIESNTLDFLFVKSGNPGQDGATLYTWVKYSQNADGSNMTDDSTNAVYIGIAYNKTSSAESTDPKDYAWSKIKGEDGVNGVDAYTIILENENVSFSTNSSGKPLTNQTFTCNISVLRGADTVSNFTIGTLGTATGITTSVSGHVITISASTSTTIPNNSGSINVPIIVDGITFTKQITYTLAKQGTDGQPGSSGTGYTVLLSNESYIFKGDTDSAIGESVPINIESYKNTTKIASTISRIGSTIVSGNQTNIATGITGLTCTIANNGTTTTKITFTATTALVTRNGKVDIAINADGQSFTKSFSFSLSLIGSDGQPGQAGADAKLVKIAASSQIFKSLDFGKTYTPSAITLSPSFQGGISYSQWQYLNGNAWTNVSGINGMSVSGANLTVNATSTVFTDSVTSVSFRCMSNDSKYFDIVTLARLYDTKDVQGEIDAINQNIIETNKTVNEISQTVDKQAQEISSKVSETVFNTRLNIVQNDVDKANNGLNRWLLEAYKKEEFATDSQAKHDVNMFAQNSSVNPFQTILLEDALLSTATTVSYTGSCIFYGLTFVYFTEETQMTTEFVASDAATLYVNGGVKHSNDSAINTTVSLVFGKGWNCIEIVLNSSDNNVSWNFGFTISEVEQCELMNCYYGSITGRTTAINEQFAELTVGLDNITSRVQKTESDISATDGKVNTLNNKYSEMQQDVEGFKTEVNSSIASTNNKFDNYSTTEQVNSLIEQKAASIEVKVSETYTTKDEFNNIEIGGRNLIRNSATLLYKDYGFGTETPVMDESGNVLTDESGNVLLL